MTDEEITNSTEEQETQAPVEEVEVTDVVADEEEEEKFEFAVEPVFESEYKGDCAYEVKVTIAPENEKAQSDKMLDELSGEVELPGFRRGRAPRKLVERKLSKVVKNEVEGKLLLESFRKYIEDNKLQTYGEMDLDGADKLKDRKSGEPIEVTFKFETTPKIELGRYRGLALEKAVVAIEGAQIEESLERLRSRYAVYEAAPEAKVQNEDQVTMDFTGTIDGEEFAGGQAEDYPYIMGSKRFFEEFEQALEGASEGEEKTCEVTFPETYSRPDLRGKVAKFVIKVKGIRRMVKPELDDEFAKKAGQDSLEALRTRIEESLRGEMDQMVRGLMERKALDEIISASTFEFPKTMVRKAVESALEERIREMHRAGATDDTLNEIREKMKDSVEADVMRDLRSLVVMNEIAVVEGLEATDEDFDKHAEDMARRLNLDSKVVSAYISGGEQRNHYEEQILRGKALDVVLNCATVTEKPMSVEEFKKASGAEDAGE